MSLCELIASSFVGINIGLEFFVQGYPGSTGIMGISAAYFVGIFVGFVI